LELLAFRRTKNAHKRNHYTIQVGCSTQLGDLSSQHTCSAMYCSLNQTVPTWKAEPD